VAGQNEQGTSRRAVLGDRGVRRFLAGYMATITGTAMTPVALSFAVLHRGGDAGDIGMVLMAEAIPLIALLLAGGVVADRLPRQVVLVGTDLIRGAGQITLALLLIWGEPSIGTMMALAAVLGAGAAFSRPAFTGAVPQIAPPEHLQAVNATVTTSAAVGEALGPALGGLIVAVAGAGWVVAFDGLTYLFSAWCVWGLSMPHEPLEHDPGFVRQMRDGWDAFRARTWLWVVVVQFSFMHLLVYPAFLVLGAVVADDHLGGSSAWGLALGGLGAGMIAGGVLMMRWRPQRLLLAGVVALTALVLPIGGLALTVPLPVLVVTTFIGGMTLSVFETGWITSLQQHVEPEMLSRVAAYDVFGSVATLPVGYALMGPLSDQLGDSGVLWLAAAVWVVASAAVVAIPSVRNLRAADDRDDREDGLVGTEAAAPIAPTLLT
jgi:MFS family permease